MIARSPKIESKRNLPALIAEISKDLKEKKKKNESGNAVAMKI